MKDVIVRPATLDDLPILLDFEQEMIESERPFDPAIRTGDDVRYYDLEELIRSSDAEILVAQTDGAIIGCGYAQIEKSKGYIRHSRHSYLGFMYVVPEHRGMGVNKQILEALEKWSLSNGIHELQLEVYQRNVPAIRAYEKFGFTVSVLQMRRNMNLN